MVERVLTHHYFVAAENSEFSEWVDITDADTFSVTVDLIWPTGKLLDRQFTPQTATGKSLKDANQTDKLDSALTFHEVSPTGPNRIT